MKPRIHLRSTLGSAIDHDPPVLSANNSLTLLKCIEIFSCKGWKEDRLILLLAWWEMVHREQGTAQTYRKKMNGCITSQINQAGPRWEKSISLSPFPRGKLRPKLITSDQVVHQQPEVSRLLLSKTVIQRAWFSGRAGHLSV